MFKSRIITDYMIYLVPLCFLFVFPGIACSSAAHGFIESDIQHDSSPAISDDDYQKTIEANSDFAFDLYREMIKEGGNVFFSPFSISQALSMVWEGARNETEMQMSEVLHYLLPKQQIHKALNKANLVLDLQTAVTLDITNSVWVQQSEQWNKEFLNTLKANYDAGIHAENLTGNPEGSRKKINMWVEDNTNGKITELMPLGSIDGLTPMVLVNAIYFYGGWKDVFEEEYTRKEGFRLTNESGVEVEFMHQINKYRYKGYFEYGDDNSNRSYETIELPYKDSSISMIIIHPFLKSFTDVEENLDSEFLNNLIDELEEDWVNLKIPKVEMNYNTRLKNPLSALGMSDTFTSRADFSGMNGKKDLWIDEVYHNAYLKIDEKGTSAAAATGIAMTRGGGPRRVEIRSPFIFVIRDNKTGIILFMGRVMNPLAGTVGTS